MSLHPPNCQLSIMVIGSRTHACRAHSCKAFHVSFPLSNLPKGTKKTMNYKRFFLTFSSCFQQHWQFTTISGNNRHSSTYSSYLCNVLERGNQLVESPESTRWGTRSDTPPWAQGEETIEITDKQMIVRKLRSLRFHATRSNRTRSGSKTKEIAGTKGHNTARIQKSLHPTATEGSVTEREELQALPF